MLAALVLVCSPISAFAAPTCQDRDGFTVRCGTPTAMPVGWRRATPDVPIAQWVQPSDVRPLLIAITLLGGLVAIIALLPDFDGSKDSDWVAQETDVGRHPRRRF